MNNNPDMFLIEAKRLAMENYNENVARESDDGNYETITMQDVFIVWFAKALQNWKALVSTNVDGDGVYYEITHNGDKRETYVDLYLKRSNTVVPATH